MTPGSAPRAQERPKKPQDGPKSRQKQEANLEPQQKDSHSSGIDFRQFSTLRITSAKRSLLPGRLFGRQATAEQADALEALAAQARVATVPTQLPD